MPFFSRLRPTAVAAHSRRTYSSFFSSGSGGNSRYFTSTKVPKPVVSSSTNANKRTPTSNAGPSPAPSAVETQDKQEGAKAIAGPKSSEGLLKNDSTDATPSSPENTTANKAPSSKFSSRTLAPSPLMASSPLAQEPHYHPSIDAKEFKLLQFFASHRPLLLLSHPSDLFVPRPPSASGEISFLPPSPIQEILAAGAPPAPPNATIDDAQEADAEAARQLSRALTMSHLGSSVAWEQTLRTLGLKDDVSRIALQEQMDQEWEDVMMDSVKRKRKKKMKKHKLKKRRKLTRASRLKLGR
ncbi:hypothetical protein BDV98DRAFT_591716 [Pterulicium gracile]|uniref:Small ribosomal subunit protein mS38 n=1 Tax=Pterulicium gracile TaxID=1884261 RepID=A0A5C3QM87_9AGAR|nr:hypothetical protein BDV98DRAFT_591716 [Pterula gracilis]